MYINIDVVYGRPIAPEIDRLSCPHAFAMPLCCWIYNYIYIYYADAYATMNGSVFCDCACADVYWNVNTDSHIDIWIKF